MTPAEIARGLTKAQREAVVNATFRKAGGVWHPEGWYAHADKRVRYALARHGITRDYLRPSNQLTAHGEAVRNHLQDTHHG